MAHLERLFEFEKCASNDRRRADAMRDATLQCSLRMQFARSSYDIDFQNRSWKTILFENTIYRTGCFSVDCTARLSRKYSHPWL